MNTRSNGKSRITTRRLFAFNSCRWLLLVSTAFLQVGPLQLNTNAFEQDHRINIVVMQFATDSFAPANRLGGAFTSTAQGQVNSLITANVNSGALSLLFEMPGLTNLTGSNQPSLNLGVANGKPILPTNNPATYAGNSDLDWWYAPNQVELTASGAPTNQIPAAIAASVLSFTNARVSFVPSPFGNGRFDLSTVAMVATVGSSSAPLESTNGYPPGHLPGENISSQLVSFASMSGGKLKGNVSAASLASIPLPSGFVGIDGYTRTQTRSVSVRLSKPQLTQAISRFQATG